MKTYSAKPSEVNKKWFIVDAEGQTLGRLATQIAYVLRGKHKAIFTPHIDTGDNIIVINAEKVAVTGKKEEQNEYMFFSGFVGGESYRSLKLQRQRNPEFVIKHAVKGMLPRNRLSRQQLTKLKIYAGPAHPHEAQAPQPHDVPGARRATA